MRASLIQLKRLAVLPAAGVLLVALALPGAAQGTPAKVVVSIKPLHSLVAGVMAGVGEPDLLVKGAASPHTYSLKPSDAKALNSADVFIRMSEAVEPFTAKVVRSLPKRVQVVTLQDSPGLKLLERRTGNTFETDHGHSHGHSHGKKVDVPDGHAWLDPDNAKVIVSRIEQTLSAKYPASAAAFKSNAARVIADLDKLSAELATALKPIEGKPYIVFHDAFQYLEDRYDLHAVGSIAVSPEIAPSGKRLTELRRKLVALAAICVFAEPQFDTRLVQNLIEGTSVRTGTLDPEGLTLEPGPELYANLMRRLASDLKECLASPA